MTNISEFKSKLQGFQEGADYIYDKSKKTYTIFHKELKNAFWGDTSNEVEYKAIEDSRGNMQFRKSATFRSSKTIKKEEQVSFVHSTEKLRDKQWQEKNLGVFPEKTPSALPTVEENNKGGFREPVEFKGIKEEFGYYKQWEGWKEPFKEPTNTAYHRKREGDVFIERKKTWKDNNQIIDISDNMEIEGIKMTAENFQQVQAQQQSINNPQHRTNSEIIQDVSQNPQNWRLDEVITQYNTQGGAERKEMALIHSSAQVGFEGAVMGDNQPVYLAQRFDQREIAEINQVLNVSQQPAQQQQTPYRWSWE